MMRNEPQTGGRGLLSGVELPFVFRSEERSVPTIRDRIEAGSTIHADEASSWDALHGHYETHRVNHSVRFYDNGICTNQAESYFSRLRRAAIGQHHCISRLYLGAYAREMAWRENHLRKPNGELFTLAKIATATLPVSRQWKGYWQRNTR